MGEADVAALSRLFLAAAQADHHAPLGEHNWLDMVQGGREGFVGLVASTPGHSHPIGYAQVSRGNTSWAVEYVIHPHHRGEKAVGKDLVAAALAEIAACGGGHVHLWVPMPGEDADDVARANGLTRGRDLWQMRRALPPPEGQRAQGVRKFVPDQDDAAWLDVNNRAFAWHPEQGGWDLETLRRRQAEPWFDPEDFLVHESSGHLDGFCWTKIHSDHDPPLGEIYVIAVDPAVRGRGLGRALVLSGLDHLAQRGLGVAMLYVDASNAPALAMYHELGFTLHHVDRAYVADIPGATSSR